MPGKLLLSTSTLSIMPVGNSPCLFLKRRSPPSKTLRSVNPPPSASAADAEAETPKCSILTSQKTKDLCPKRPDSNLSTRRRKDWASL